MRQHLGVVVAIPIAVGGLLLYGRAWDPDVPAPAALDPLGPVGAARSPQLDPEAPSVPAARPYARRLRLAAPEGSHPTATPRSEPSVVENDGAAGGPAPLDDAIRSAVGEVSSIISRECDAAALQAAWAASASRDAEVQMSGETEVQVEIDARGLVDVLLLDNGTTPDFVVDCYRERVWAYEWPAQAHGDVVVSVPLELRVTADAEAGTIDFSAVIDGQ